MRHLVKILVNQPAAAYLSSRNFPTEHFRSGAISRFTAGARRRNRARAIQGKTLNIDLPASGDPTTGNCGSSLTWEFNTGSFSGGVTPVCGDKEGDRAGHLLQQGTFMPAGELFFH